MSKLTNFLITGIERSLGRLQSQELGTLACYGLITDEDLRTVMGCALTREAFDRMGAERFHPAEWLEHYEPFDLANTEMGAIADRHYAEEADDVGPDDDHLRPWKAELYASLVEALRNRKEWGSFDQGVFLIATSHDPNDWLFRQVDASTKR